MEPVGGISAAQRAADAAAPPHGLRRREHAAQEMMQRVTGVPAAQSVADAAARPHEPRRRRDAAREMMERVGGALPRMPVAWNPFIHGHRSGRGHTVLEEDRDLLLPTPQQQQYVPIPQQRQHALLPPLLLPLRDAGLLETDSAQILERSRQTRALSESQLQSLELRRDALRSIPQQQQNAPLLPLLLPSRDRELMETDPAQFLERDRQTRAFFESEMRTLQQRRDVRRLARQPQTAGTPMHGPRERRTALTIDTSDSTLGTRAAGGSEQGFAQDIQHIAETRHGGVETFGAEVPDRPVLLRERFLTLRQEWTAARDSEPSVARPDNATSDGAVRPEGEGWHPFGGGDIL